MAEVKELREQINAVVEARQKAKETTDQRSSTYQKWVEANQQILDNEIEARTVCVEAEATLREMTLQVYTETGNKAPEIGVGIRVRQVPEYENEDALAWGINHSLALSLDRKAFEAIAKTTPLDFVVWIEETTATISPDLKKIERVNDNA